MCSVQVSQECVSKFNELKLGKSIKYIIYKLSDDNKEIVVEDTSEDADWDGFREKLINAKSKTKSGALTKGPRYAVYDFAYDLSSGEGSRSKITFIAWSPDDAGIQVRPEWRLGYGNSADTDTSPRWFTPPPRTPSSALSTASPPSSKPTMKMTLSTPACSTKSPRVSRRLHD